jgi:hypothetical protein
VKPERWGSLLVQEKYREEKACDKRHPYLTIIIIIIIYQEAMKLGNYRRQPYWALHTYFGKC